MACDTEMLCSEIIFDDPIASGADESSAHNKPALLAVCTEWLDTWQTVGDHEGQC